MMDVVSVKFKKHILKEIDSMVVGHNFNSRTEFIREAVRDKITELSKEDLMREFLKYKGKAKVSTSYGQNRKTREIASKELLKELEKQFK